jgi:hypothetical protein
MTTLTEQYTLANNATFQLKTGMAMVQIAETIAGENPNTANHEKRMQWATMVLRDPITWTMRMAYGVSALGTISDAASADANYVSAVSTIWNSYAG